MGENRLLDGINSPNDLKKLNNSELKILASEIRSELIKTVSENGGHLASNLGVVELTIALHKTFNSPEDKIVWDVGHQAYTHKILTGREKQFCTLRKEGGISGFTHPSESPHDVFYSGHSSTSVSASYGLAVANMLKGNDNKVVSVLGDGSFTGGMVFEGMNNAGRNKNCNLIVVLNDNKMSISKNVGSVAMYLAKIRSKPKYFLLKYRTYNLLLGIPLIGEGFVKIVKSFKSILKNFLYGSTMFEKMGFTYMGPIDGHNIEQLCDGLEAAKKKKEPVLFHIITTKGKGYNFAEKAPSIFHGISKFDIETGEPIVCGKTFSNVFGDYICDIAKNDKRICAVTAAMALGTGLEEFSKKFSDRFFDVGIAEEHAVTFTSGLAKNGMLPVFAVYSTFLQRCYDQLLHDCSMQKLKMIFAVDRAGFVGSDGESHQGLFDVAFLNTIPNIDVYSPSCFNELKKCLNNVFYHSDNSSVVRYPRGIEKPLPDDYEFSGNSFDLYGKNESDIVLVTYGRLFYFACEALKKLEENNISVRIIKLNKIKPIDENAVKNAIKSKHVFFFEEGIKSGGVAEKFGVKLLENNYNGVYRITAVNDEFVVQNSVENQLEHYNLDSDGMVKEVKKEIGG